MKDSHETELGTLYMALNCCHSEDLEELSLSDSGAYFRTCGDEILLVADVNNAWPQSERVSPHEVMLFIVQNMLTYIEFIAKREERKCKITYIYLGGDYEKKFHGVV